METKPNVRTESSRHYVCVSVDVMMRWKQRLTSHNRSDTPALAESVCFFSSYWRWCHQKAHDLFP